MRVKGQAGFTLVEVTLVIVMLGVLTTSIVVSGDLMGQRAASLSHQLSADLRYARQLANASRTRHGVEVTNATTYRVFRDDGGAGSTVDHPMTGSPFVVNLSGDYNGVSLSTTLGGAPPKAQFDSIGRPFDGAGGAIGAGVNAIDVSGGGGVVKTVTVVPETGVVLVN